MFWVHKEANTAGYLIPKASDVCDRVALVYFILLKQIRLIRISVGSAKPG